MVDGLAAVPGIYIFPAAVQAELAGAVDSVSLQPGLSSQVVECSNSQLPVAAVALPGVYPLRQYLVVSIHSSSVGVAVQVSAEGITVCEHADTNEQPGNRATGLHESTIAAVNTHGAGHVSAVGLVTSQAESLLGPHVASAAAVNVQSVWEAQASASAAVLQYVAWASTVACKLHSTWLLPAAVQEVMTGTSCFS